MLPDQSYTADRRSAARAPVNLPAVVFIGGHAISGRILDLSPTGARLRVPGIWTDALRPGPARLSVSGHRPFNVSIRWHCSHEAGLQFTGRSILPFEWRKLATADEVRPRLPTQTLNSDD
ncbi:PilZ domain-containing protein [Palleronia abyssalis]|uniref:PilZ domain-containing protein n=1 Tax=Palleronia abyssalis TaxID=1501240 RepID=UPI000D562083